ncbi:hypothetical protein SESBI_26982 [Sesbania bispinosa]|nr:hypothetical protein SESBI_26982 [Sesbania bispinosa]
MGGGNQFCQSCPTCSSNFRTRRRCRHCDVEAPCSHLGRKKIFDVVTGWTGRGVAASLTGESRGLEEEGELFGWPLQ